MTVSKYIFLRIVENFRFNYGSLLVRAFVIICVCGISAFQLDAQLTLSIGEVQGEGLESPYVGEEVIIKDVVVLLKSGGRTIVQSAKGFEDGNSNTSDGMVILATLNAPIGSSLQVKGNVIEFEALTCLSAPEIIETDIVSKPSPDPINLDAYFGVKEQWTIEDLEKIESMTIDFESATVCQASNSSNYLIISLTESRPKREPGLDGNAISGIPSFDKNVEIIAAVGLTSDFNASVPAGSHLSGLGYFLQDEDFNYVLLKEFEVSAIDPVRSVDNEPDNFSLATINLLFLDSAESTFGIRKEKIVNYILEGLNAPDVVAVQEVANLNTLSALAEDLNDSGEKEYSFYLEQGNNSSSINNGFLISDRIDVESVEQIGETQSLSLGGSLHDRPPLLLKAQLKTDPQIPIQVLNLHIRSLSGISGSNGSYVRQKRLEQAKSVERMVDNLWSSNLFVVGDLNAFQFSDGYVDVYRQIAGGLSEGALLPITSPAENDLISASAELDENEKYSFIFNGSVQQLDHILYSSLENMSHASTAFYRGNSDAPDAWLNQVSISGRNSDHDGLVSSFDPAYPWSNSTTPVIELARPNVSYSNPFQHGEFLRFSPNTNDIFSFRIYDLMGRLVAEQKSDFVKSDEQWEIYPEPLDYNGVLIFEISGENFQWVSPIYYSSHF